MQFTMLVKEIFNFQDGRIVFVGEVSGEEKSIKGCICNIFINDHLFGKVHIEGEMIANGNKTNFRSVSTTDKINIADLPYHNNTVRLTCIT